MKALIRRFFDEVNNRGNLAVADEVVADASRSHNGPGIEVLGPAGAKAVANAQRAAFPDQDSTINDLILEGDKVVVRGHDIGTHVGTFMGPPGTGRHFHITWIDIFRVENGKLAEAWLEIDVGAFRRQFGG
jgi:predicted ester cyclase